MPKRMLASRPGIDPFVHDRPHKRPRTFWLGAQCWQYDCKTSRPRPRTTFMHLPLELREEIYHFAMCDMTKKMKHPWDPLPGKDRFTAYFNLRLLNHQIGAEAKKTFNKHYEPQMIFYFDNVPDLWDQWELLEDHPRRCKTRFYLRAMNNDKTAMERQPGENRVREQVEMLIEDQYDDDLDEWLEAPDMYNGQLWDQYASGEEWMPDGFEIRAGTHSVCEPTFPTRCVAYKELLYPPIAKSLSIQAYTWKQRFPHETVPGRSQSWYIGSTVLEGNICDIDWDDHDLDASREEIVLQRSIASFASLEHELYHGEYGYSPFRYSAREGIDDDDDDDDEEQSDSDESSDGSDDSDGADEDVVVDLSEADFDSEDSLSE